MSEAPAESEPQVCDGAWMQEMAALASRHRIALLLGYVERCVTGIYNAAILIDRRGICIANYRQTHVARGAQGSGPSWQRGQWLTAMPLEGQRLGLLVGYDILFPEPARALALAGCSLIAVLGGVSDTDADIVLPARARENRCWIAHSGPVPQLFGPDGRASHLENLAEGLVVARLEGDLPIGQGRPELMGDRRPRLYQELAIRAAEEDARPS